MTMQRIAALLLLLLFWCTLAHAGSVRTIAPGDVFESRGRHLDVYYFEGFSRSPLYAFTTVLFALNITNSTSSEQPYNVFRNTNVSELYEEHRDSQSYLSSLHNFRYLYSLQLRYLPVFTPSYIGIESEQAYAAKLLIYYINWPWRLLPFLGGMMIFLLSRRLTRHVAFYYSTGTIVGICGSLVIVVYMLQRLLPKKTVFTSFLIGGYSFALYCAYAVYGRLTALLVEHFKYVAMYVVSVGMLSLAVCYYIGPPKSERTYNLTQWALMLIASAIMFLSCNVEEFTLMVIVGMWLAPLLPLRKTNTLRNIWLRFRPPQHRYLTESEYYQQGQVETAKALNNLRKYASSPECDPWRIVSRLQHPDRFAAFVAGAPHVSNTEMMRYADVAEDYEEIEDDYSDDEESDQEVMPTPQSLPPMSHVGREKRMQVRNMTLNAETPSTTHAILRHRDVAHFLTPRHAIRAGTPNSVHSVDVLNNRVRINRSTRRH